MESCVLFVQDVNETVRVLLVEDDEDDAVLLRSALEHGGLAAEVDRIETPEALEAALQNDRYDIVVSDYCLPGFTGRQALEIVQQARRDLPVIIVSGSVPEEVIVQAVKAGARDYLMKPNLTRLAVAVEREIQEAEDRRERRNLEEQLRHAQRLESLGVLAGGVAHDFNNILTGILGNASLATEIVPVGNEVRPLLDAVVSAAEHAAVLTRQLLAYAGKGQFVVEPIDLSALVRSTHSLLRMSVSRNIRLRFDLQEGLPKLMADRGQIEQILMNLAINASEALGQVAAGEILISTGFHDLDGGADPKNVAGNGVERGTYVWLSVTDNGPGIAPGVQAKMFDPFFSTKFTGRGLGLSAVLGIVRAHRGALHVDSEAGRGARFTVQFPATVLAAPAASATQARRALEPLSGVVLVIDDEEIVRKTASVVLQQHGLSVVLAENGSEGVEVFRRMGERVAAVLLDLTMPVMSGEATLRAIRKIRPEVPVVISSGYSEQDARERLQTSENVRFLQKPYGSIELARAVQYAMRGEG
jgi:signal transduction histidine kinase